MNTLRGKHQVLGNLRDCDSCAVDCDVSMKSGWMFSYSCSKGGAEGDGWSLQTGKGQLFWLRFLSWHSLSPLWSELYYWGHLLVLGLNWCFCSKSVSSETLELVSLPSAETLTLWRPKVEKKQYEMNKQTININILCNMTMKLWKKCLKNIKQKCAYGWINTYIQQFQNNFHEGCRAVVLDYITEHY